MGPGPLAGADLIGRADELATLTSQLPGRVRLVTLTGPPGVGKTRLAVEAAEALADAFDDGVVFVDLTSAHDRASAVAAMARSLGLSGGSDDRPARRLYDWLADHHLLLVLDNGEQVAGLSEEVSALLDACPRLRILVTSRENLHLSLEHELPVPPLAMPGHEDLTDLDRLVATEAVALYVSAAREVRPDFEVNERNAEALAEICVRLDGLPLALRIAAVRSKMFSTQEIAERLRDRRAILEAAAVDVPDRHRSLRAAISWSHAVLGEREQVMFRRLAVFAGPWTLDAADAVWGPADDTLDTMASLVDKSLIQRVADDGVSRFQMLQSIHDFAAEQLDLHAERTSVTGRHLAYFVEIARAAEASLGTADEAGWREAFGAQQADLSAALDQALVIGDLNAALTLATAIAWDAYTLGDVGAGHRTVTSVLARVDASDVTPDPVALCYGWIIAGVIAWARGDLDLAEDYLERATAACETSGDVRRLSIAQAFVGHVARSRGQFDRAADAHEQVRTLYDDVLLNVRGGAWARFDLGRTAWDRGDLDAAAALLADALARFRDQTYPWAAAWAGWALGGVHLDQGSVSDGARQLGSALRDFEAVADQRGVALCFEELALAAIMIDRPDRAARLLGAAQRLRERLAAPLGGVELRRVEQSRASLDAALGPAAVDRERQVGHELTYPSATALGHDSARLIEATSATVVVPGAERSDDVELLTSRERQVAALLATGSSNQQIARRLGITTRTAEAHVHHIMVKLDARSRSEVAVWASNRDLVAAQP